jgi:putative nucleotidyltransferase with HDIG domain
MPPPPTLDEVRAQAVRLPCSPALLPRLGALLAREDSTAADLEEVITLDPVLAGSTLRLANSAFFGGGLKVDNLAEAILRLGHLETYRLAALSLTSRWMNLGIEGYGWEPGDFCRHSLCVAIAAEQLAALTGRLDRGLAYTAGLLHEIGKLAVAHACGGFFPAIRQHQQFHHCTWLEAEQCVLGYTHATVGGELLTGWRFPENLVAVAAHLQHPARAPADLAPLMAHVHAAKYLATCMGAGVAEDGFLFELDSAFLSEWGFTRDLLDEALPTVLAKASQLLHESLNHGPVAL